MTPMLKSLLIAHVRAENAHDMEATLATLHPQCLFEDVAMDQVFHGREGARLHYLQWWTAFDLRFAPESASYHWTGEDSCVAESVFTGRHIGPFLGREPTDRSVRFQFVVFVSFRDGLIAGERFYYDLSGILRQVDVQDASSRLTGMLT